MAKNRRNARERDERDEPFYRTVSESVEESEADSSDSGISRKIKYNVPGCISARKFICPKGVLKRRRPGGNLVRCLMVVVVLTLA